MNGGASTLSSLGCDNFVGVNEIDNINYLLMTLFPQDGEPIKTNDFDLDLAIAYSTRRHLGKPVQDVFPPI